MQTLERTVGRSSRIAVFLLAAGYLATLCPFYAVRHHAWIFAFLPALLLLKEDFSCPEPLEAVSEKKSPRPLLLAVAILGALMPVIFTFFTWFHEFPWRGDYNFHLPQSLVLSRTEWVIVIFALWGLLGLSFFLFQNNKRRSAWGVLLLVALSVIACELWRPIPPHYARYPATVYVLQTPLFWLAGAIGAVESINLNRLFESLALIAWLFLLRPLILRKWVTWSIVAVVWLLVTQGDTLYYLGGAYLEPWSLVFCLIALEVCIDGDFRLAFAFIGLASIIKEQAIVLLPFFVLAAWAKEGFPWHRLLNLGLWALFSMLPFLSYFLYRRDSNVWRTAEIADVSSLANGDRIREFLHRVTIQFSMTGTFIIFFLIIAILVITWMRRRRFLTPELFVIGSVIFLPLFFYSDRISAGWTGYPRFHLVSFFLVIFLAVYVMFCFRSLVMVLLLTVFGLAQLPRFAHVWRFRNETAANFFEHYDAPIFLSIRPLFAESEKTQGLTAGSAVEVVEPTEFDDLRQFNLGYPDLAVKYKVITFSRPPGGASFQVPAVRPLWILVPRVRLANLNARQQQSNLYDQFKQSEDAINDVKREIASLGGSWTEVKDDKTRLVGFVGRLQ
jgi:hypothetical protein